MTITLSAVRKFIVKYVMTNGNLNINTLAVRINEELKRRFFVGEIVTLDNVRTNFIVEKVVKDTDLAVLKSLQDNSIMYIAFPMMKRVKEISIEEIIDYLNQILKVSPFGVVLVENALDKIQGTPSANKNFSPQHPHNGDSRTSNLELIRRKYGVFKDNGKRIGNIPIGTTGNNYKYDFLYQNLPQNSESGKGSNFPFYNPLENNSPLPKRPLEGYGFSAKKQQQNGEFLISRDVKDFRVKPAVPTNFKLDTSKMKKLKVLDFEGKDLNDMIKIYGFIKKFIGFFSIKLQHHEMDMVKKMNLEEFAEILRSPNLDDDLSFIVHRLLCEQLFHNISVTSKTKQLDNLESLLKILSKNCTSEETENFETLDGFENTGWTKKGWKNHIKHVLRFILSKLNNMNLLCYCTLFNSKNLDMTNFEETRKRMDFLNLIIALIMNCEEFKTYAAAKLASIKSLKDESDILKRKNPFYANDYVFNPFKALLGIISQEENASASFFCLESNKIIILIDSEYYEMDDEDLKELILTLGLTFKSHQQLSKNLREVLEFA